VQPADLFATLGNWLANADQSAPQPCPTHESRTLLSARDDSEPRRKLAIARSSTGETALATPAWFVRAPAPPVPDAETDARKLELYVKPDDRFEANEVSDRCHEIVEEYREAVQALESALEQGVIPEITLSDSLVEDAETRSKP
jgi:hypothetical protein